MQEQFLNHIARFDLCTPGDTLLLAVSGGVDSMAMLHLFHAAGYNLGVAHCNFQLRGKASDGDEAFVHDACTALNIPVFVRRFDTEAYAWENGLSTQMAARELRYAWFEEIRTTHHYAYLATGHHFDDSMETILLNITRGASTEGMAGIPVKNGTIIRPLLFATRAQVEKYAADKKLSWREDESNLTDDYQRNFIRHQIIPLLKELNPSLETTWQAGIEKIQGELAVLHEAFALWGKKYITQAGDKITLTKQGLQAHPQAQSLLWRFVKTFGFNFEQAKEVVQALRGQPGKKFLSATHLLVIDRDVLIITPHQHHWHDVTVAHDTTESTLGPWHLRIEPCAPNERGTSGTEAVLDASLLRYPLLWRKWKPGDAFHPLGMDHKKKLSDFFIDKKLSIADKESATVLESHGHIVWVAGHRIDDRFKVTEATKQTLKFVLTTQA
ncbi:tRNA lysidine(34) synthetase TilS [Chryseolinea lacunae]|uniref:tRNA(Ile)-lysidine synthase n=1 Tax=Chryseolinea lacunae TaxID=2801331 RepID=A0ABS1KKD8_9BACT|nr:tRNA lysidine(34) synthetase TilS [Chryseolinea lacunae]MBL0739915.1 tRNA lysidine(34) synthetase TilS [Chryseolinea lacunae]